MISPNTIPQDRYRIVRELALVDRFVRGTHASVPEGSALTRATLGSGVLNAFGVIVAATDAVWIRHVYDCPCSTHPLADGTDYDVDETFCSKANADGTDFDSAETLEAKRMKS